MINIGVIGYGYWGPNLVRNYMTNSRTCLVVVCDRLSSRLEEVRTLYPSVQTTAHSAELIENPKIDAIAVATPVASHYELAMAALKAGKHVFVEKPITTSHAEASRLIDEAADRKLTLLVDHTFLYTAAVKKIRSLVAAPTFGKLQYYDSMRVNLGIFQDDVNVLWDLAVHDLSIMSYIIPQQPLAVSAVGHRHVVGQRENVAYVTMFFPDNIIAHINVNWLSPVKVRRTLISGSKNMIVYDDLETSEKIKVYDNGITVTESADDIRKLLISYRTGDMWSPKIEGTEALQVEVNHFVDCIEKQQKPISGGEEGLHIVRVLEAADESMRARGAPVEI